MRCRGSDGSVRPFGDGFGVVLNKADTWSQQLLAPPVWRLMGDVRVAFNLLLLGAYDVCASAVWHYLYARMLNAARHSPLGRSRSSVELGRATRTAARCLVARSPRAPGSFCASRKLLVCLRLVSWRELLLIGGSELQGRGGSAPVERQRLDRAPTRSAKSLGSCSKARRQGFVFRWRAHAPPGGMTPRSLVDIAGWLRARPLGLNRCQNPRRHRCGNTASVWSVGRSQKKTK